MTVHTKHKLSVEKYKQSLIDQIDDIKEKVHLIFDSPESGKFNQRIIEKKWSVFEHLDHMNKTVAAYFVQMDKIAPNVSNNNVSSYQPGFKGNLFIKLMEPPPKIKLKTFGVFKPAADFNQEAISKKFLELRAEFESRVVEACTKGKLKSKLSSPVSNLLKFELGEAFLILTAHDRRHLYTINNLMEKL